jgi:hypothetical protein
VKSLWNWAVGRRRKNLCSTHSISFRLVLLLLGATILGGSNVLLGEEIKSRSQSDLQDIIKIEMLHHDECKQAIQLRRKFNNDQLGLLDQVVISDVKKTFLRLITTLHKQTKRESLDLDQIRKINGITVENSNTKMSCGDNFTEKKNTTCLFIPDSADYCYDYPVNYSITFDAIEKLKAKNHTINFYKNNIYMSSKYKAQNFIKAQPNKVVELLLLHELANQVCITKDEISILFGEVLTRVKSNNTLPDMEKRTGACEFCIDSYDRDGYFVGFAPSKSKYLDVNSSVKPTLFFSKYQSSEEACLSAAYFVFSD